MHHQPGTHLVVDHVLEALVVCGPHEHRAGNLLSRPRVVQDLVAVPLHAVRCEDLCDVVHGELVKRRGVSPAAL